MPDSKELLTTFKTSVVVLPPVLVPRQSEFNPQFSLLNIFQNASLESEQQMPNSATQPDPQHAKQPSCTLFPASHNMPIPSTSNMGYPVSPGSAAAPERPFQLTGMQNSTEHLVGLSLLLPLFRKCRVWHH